MRSLPRWARVRAACSALGAVMLLPSCSKEFGACYETRSCDSTPSGAGAMGGTQELAGHVAREGGAAAFTDGGIDGSAGPGASGGGGTGSGVGGAGGETLSPCAAGCAAPTPVCDLTTDRCVGCVTSEQCAGERPVCDAATQTCVECASSADCSGAAPVCDTARGACVECTEGEGCDGATPVCDITTNRCAQCNVDGDCDAATPLCEPDKHVCVECLEHTQCGDLAPLCDPVTHTCAECLENTDCTDSAASRCHSRTCAPCQDDTDCAHIDGRGVCDAGQCVECTPTRADACGYSPCNGVTRACSAYLAADRLACQSCDTDANCAETGSYCVPLRYQGDERGGYCLRAMDSECVQPFPVVLTDRTSLSGVTGKAYCGINEWLTTCEAVRALFDGVICVDGGDADCPEGGLCRDIGKGYGECTHVCNGIEQCLPGLGCGSGDPATPPSYCGG